jgi:hypothetical protein
MAMKDQLAKWRRDPALFMTQALIDPQNGGRFELFEAERIFLDRAFRPNADGDLPYKDILWSCIKKSGKSTFGALCMLYTVICLGGRFAEAYVSQTTMTSPKVGSSPRPHASSKLARCYEPRSQLTVSLSATAHSSRRWLPTIGAPPASSRSLSLRMSYGASRPNQVSAFTRSAARRRRVTLQCG